jgi:NADPH-dependent 2,4-dienoyl-CoA reductase/sulfur reductase-like enzyme
MKFILLFLSCLLQCSDSLALQLFRGKGALPPLPAILTKPPKLLSSFANLWTRQRTTPIPETVDVVVVGAGLCGSTAAFYLDKQGYQVLLAEEASEVGGCVNTKRSKPNIVS